MRAGRRKHGRRFERNLQKVVSDEIHRSGRTATAFTIIRPELVRGAGDEKLKAGLIGCGGRGTEAAQQFLHGNDNVELVAMGDIFEDHLERSLGQIRESKYKGVADKVKVDPDHHFVGFDAYQKVLASDIDVVLLATPPGYRPEHFVAAVEAKKHIFAEKPFGTDPVGVRKVMAASKKAEELKLTVMSGAQRHHQDGYVETWRKVRDGAIGDILATYAYWVGTPVIQQKERDAKWSDMVFQHRAWYSFVWLCGDQVVEQHLHNIDVVNWFMGTHPAEGVRFRRRGVAAAHRDLRQYFRSYRRGFHLCEWRTHVESLPPVSKARLHGCIRVDRRHARPHQLQGHGAEGRRRSLCAGTHRFSEEYPRPGAVYKRWHGCGGEYYDLYHGSRIGLLGTGDYLGPDDGFYFGPAAEGV